MEKVMNKKQKKIVKKAKKIRSIIMMSLMCIMLLSAATYAWFTLSSTAKVSNLTMTVGEANGLRVAMDSGSTPKESDWKPAITFPDNAVKGVLVPATYDGSKFYRPEYNDDGEVDRVVNDNSVVELNTSNNDTKKEGHYYTLTFYMESLGEDANIRLVEGENLSKDSRKGTYVIENKKGQKTEQNAAAAVRISINAQDSDVSGIYEPNCDMEFSGTVTKASTASGYSKKNYTTVQQKSDGTFVDGTSHSKAVFKLKADKPTLITLHIWIEGDDAQCVNQIQMDNLIGQLYFEKQD